MMNKQTVYDLKPEGKVVYIRVDYNVPHDKEGNILDDRRIRATIPTIQYLLNQGAAIVLASHMGIISPSCCSPSGRTFTKRSQIHSGLHWTRS